MNSKKKNVRETVLELLETIEKNQSYSNLLLHHAIEKNNLPTKDIGLLNDAGFLFKAFFKKSE
jgi:16S rRNA (cytosine967-C5)-methyltransferase